MERQKTQSYCIQWENDRGQTHTGPELRRKTFEEAQELSGRMNSNPEFHNQSHSVVISKEHTPRSASDDNNRGVTPVYLLKRSKHGRPKMETSA
ncbi:hypothetical protein LCGC14_2001300 [marine sediment metagenome]|uniref:Uncharacterized protein n=1 Tax=marine sediment metagenome TaxID=412755 RepID=A0A0F9HGL2_9ZZZZ